MKIKSKIYKRANGKWTLNYIHPKTNKRIRKSFDKKVQCKNYLESLEAEIIQKQRSRQGEVDFNKVIQLYTLAYPSGSFLKVKWYVTAFKDEFGRISPANLSADQIQDWLVKIKKQKNLSLKSISNMKEQLSKIYPFLIKNGFASENPFKRIVIRSRFDFYRRDKLTEIEVDKIFENLSYFSPHYIYPIARIIYKTGMNPREVISLKWDHVGFDLGQISIVSARAGFIRSFIAPKEVLSILRSKPKISNFILTNRYKRKIDRNNIRFYLTKLKQGYPDTPEFSLEDLRHAFAFHHIEKGGRISYITKMLGHKSIEQTKRFYVKPKRENFEKTAAGCEASAADWAIELRN